MDRIDRKAALNAYRERKPQVGIYRLTCAASGQVWVGATPTLATIQNRFRFTLAQGGHPNAALQAAANAHGADAIAFEVIEELDPETPEFSRDRLLKDRLAHWAGHLDAAPL
jgi:hypothetical protein